MGLFIYIYTVDFSPYAGISVTLENVNDSKSWLVQMFNPYYVVE